MRQTDDFEDNSGGLPIIYMALGVSVFILVVLGIVLAVNKKPVKNTRPVMVVEESSEEDQRYRAHRGGLYGTSTHRDKRPNKTYADY